MNTPQSPAMVEVDRLPELPVPAWPKDTSFLPEGCIQDDAYDAEQVRVFAFKSAEHLRAAMERLLSSSGGIAAASEEELTDAANDVSQDVELREQAGAILQARAVLRGFKPNTPDAKEAIAAERAEVVRLREALRDLLGGVGECLTSQGVRVIDSPVGIKARNVLYPDAALATPTQGGGNE